MKENKIMIHVLVTADLNCARKADRIKKKGKVFHPFRALVKKIVLIGIAVTSNAYKLAAMVGVCNTAWAYNVLWNIDPDFIVHSFVHGGKSCNFA